MLYTKDFTQDQVGDIFDQIYGQHYSKASISRMVESVRTQLDEWLERGLEEYLPSWEVWPWTTRHLTGNFPTSPSKGRFSQIRFRFCQWNKL